MLNSIYKFTDLAQINSKIQSFVLEFLMRRRLCFRKYQRGFNLYRLQDIGSIPPKQDKHRLPQQDKKQARDREAVQVQHEFNKQGPPCKNAPRFHGYTAPENNRRETVPTALRGNKEDTKQEQRFAKTFRLERVPRSSM